MIRVRKSSVPPQELASSGCSADAVRERILVDQDYKCYLCERKLVTDFQVDHRQSRANHPGKANDWRNLLMACGYCNQKKSSQFDGIVDPTVLNVEEWISQIYDSSRETFSFSPKVAVGESVEQTCELLNRIFNGLKPKMLTVREKAFRQEFLEFYNRFLAAVNEYLKTSSDDNGKRVSDELLIQRNYLGFKYWIIVNDLQLKNKFLPFMQWNRQ